MRNYKDCLEDYDEDKNSPWGDDGYEESVIG